MSTDFRLYRSYSGASDINFRTDTLFKAVYVDQLISRESYYEFSKAWRDMMPSQACVQPYLEARVAAENLNDDLLTYSQAYALAQFIGCEFKNQSRNEHLEKSKLEPFTSTRDIVVAIHQYFDNEFNVLLERRRSSSIKPGLIALVAAGDEKSVKKLLYQNENQHSRSILNLFHREKNIDTESAGDTTSEDLLFETDGNENTALHYAMIFKELGCLRILLEFANAGGNKTCSSFNERQTTNLCKKLLYKRNCNGDTALYWGILNSSLESIKIMVSFGFDVMRRSEMHDKRYSPLEVLVKYARLSGEKRDLLKNVLTMMSANPFFDINRGHGSCLEDQEERRPNHIFGDSNSEDDDERQEDDDHSILSEDEPQEQEEDARSDGEDYDDAHDDDINNRDQDLLTLLGELERIDAQLGDEDELDLELEAERRMMNGIMDLRCLSRRRNGSLLAFAAEKGDVDTVSLLLQHGAKDNSAILSAICCIVENRNVYFLSRSRYNNSTSMGCEVAKAIACMMVLLEEGGADINQRDSFGRTPLMAAAEKDCIEAVRFFLSRGADTSARDDEGSSALDIATSHHNDEIATALRRASQLSRLASSNLGERRRSSKESAVMAMDEVAGVEEEEIPRSELCIVCLDRRRHPTLAPCGHKITCKRCLRLILDDNSEKHKCPLCNEKIESYVLQTYS